VLPLAYLVIVLGDDASDWAQTVLSERAVGLLGRSVALAAAVTATAVAIAVPVAWLTVRTDLPGRRAWSVLCALPLVIPSYMGAYLLVSALGPRASCRACSRRRSGSSACPPSTASPARGWR
jgi:iron(III) transport system permease protein